MTTNGRVCASKSRRRDGAAAAARSNCGVVRLAPRAPRARIAVRVARGEAHPVARRGAGVQPALGPEVVERERARIPAEEVERRHAVEPQARDAVASRGQRARHVPRRRGVAGSHRRPRPRRGARRGTPRSPSPPSSRRARSGSRTRRWARSGFHSIGIERASSRSSRPRRAQAGRVEAGHTSVDSPSASARPPIADRSKPYSMFD